MAGNSDQALMQERNRSSSIGAMGLMGFLLEWRQALEPVVVAVTRPALRVSALGAAGAIFWNLPWPAPLSAR